MLLLDGFEGDVLEFSLLIGVFIILIFQQAVDDPFDSKQVFFVVVGPVVTQDF